MKIIKINEENQVLRIGVTAPRETGKTSYLLGLYGALTLLRNPDPNYPFFYTWTDNLQRGLLESQLETLLNEDIIGNARFPKKTKDISSYKIQVRHKTLNDVLDVELVDYPGELLRGDTDKEATTTAASVTESLTKCQAFIVLLEAPFLFAPPVKMRSKTAANNIANVLQNAFPAGQDSWFARQGIPVAFCLSKFDELPPDQANMELAYLKVKELFSEFFEASHNHPVLVAGVSLGERIREGGEFAPYQVQTPLEFCLAMSAFNMRRYMDDAKDYFNGKAEKRRSMNLLEKVGDLFSDEGGTTSDYAMKAGKYKENTAFFQKFGVDAANFTSKSIKGSYKSAYSLYYQGKLSKFKESINNWEFPIEAL